MSATQDEINKALFGRKKRSKGPEKGIQDTILEYLNMLRGVAAWRRNVGALKKDDSFVRFGQTGQADISGIGPEGIRIEIEVKQPGKEPTEAQEYWLNMIHACGGIAFWCDSLESCIQQLRFEYEKRGWTL